MGLQSILRSLSVASARNQAIRAQTQEQGSMAWALGHHRFDGVYSLREKPGGKKDFTL